MTRKQSHPILRYGFWRRVLHNVELHPRVRFAITVPVQHQVQRPFAELQWAGFELTK